MLSEVFALEDLSVSETLVDPDMSALAEPDCTDMSSGASASSTAIEASARSSDTLSFATV
ncbi:MAG: hypothetical protein MR610_03520 [Olsenella sp.]|nr:hypothetical protein [Olsenella sp.]